MAPAPRYGSISSYEQVEVELLPTGEAFIGTVEDDEILQNKTNQRRRHRNHRHHCLSYTLAAFTCLFAARYWHSRSESYDGTGVNIDHSDINTNGPDGVRSRLGRVPMPPALSNLDPASDLGFRSTTRSGLALPSKAWGEHYSRAEEDGKFAALPTNEWYLNLLSHVAASDPSKAGEIAHVYTIPYVLGVAPPQAPKLPNGSSTTTTETMAGIELFLPILKAGDSNMQMVFDKNNGISLGSIVDDVSHSKGSSSSSSSSLTSYVVDPHEAINPLGVSLKWNYVNIISHIVRGMPYGTVRFGRDSKNKIVLPTLVAGNRARSILIDSDDDSTSTSTNNKMECGSFTGQSIDQDPNHLAAISSDGKANVYSVQREIILHMDESDFTWAVFFSKPVKVQCFTDAVPVVSVPGANPEVEFRLNVVEVNDGQDDDPAEELVVRVALLNQCTSGKGIIKEHCEHLQTLNYDTISSKNKSKKYLEVLREGSMLYPRSPLVGTQFPEDDNDDEARETSVVFDWDVTSAKSNRSDVIIFGSKNSAVSSTVVGSVGLRATSFEETLQEKKAATGSNWNDAFIMFALPHHLESLPISADSEFDDSLCLRTFHGRTCLVQGSIWKMSIAHGPPQSFLADRPPAADAIPLIADALSKDINFKLSDNVLRGAADTYFPAKIIAKMGRIIEINNELQNLKLNKGKENYSDTDEKSLSEAAGAASTVTLPSKTEVESLLDDLQQAVEVWLNPGGKEKGGAEAEFIYDESWGGIVNCGCKYAFKKGHEGEGSCNNTFPECPALDDVNEDFGNGWYNDHHFHYGYMIYAAAIVAKNRPVWGRKYYDRVLLLIRDIANPSAEDRNFPMFRQKDWYLGNSWAGGLMSMQLSPHGREQESSSEAIAAFEGIALFGDVMMNAFAADDAKLASARLVRNVGEVLTAMEVSAANRYWHVWGSTNSTTASTGERGTFHVNAYPPEYTKPVVGMLYETMANFQTWFAPEDVVSYGIQLIPLTAIAERRDDPEWSSKLYPIYAESCQVANEENDGFCDDNGWSIIQSAVLAETGEMEDALKMASAIPASVFVSQGACGNSLTNTLWFISTRKQLSSVEL